MPNYRAFMLKEDGHVDSAVVFFCPDDEAARRHASQLVADKDVELWYLDRRIQTFKAEKREGALLRDGNGSATQRLVP